MRFTHTLIVALIVGVCLGCSRSQTQGAYFSPVELHQQVPAPFRFVVYGDTRFHNPRDTDASNAEARQALVKAIGEVHPDFITIAGDVTYNGDDPDDWKVWDRETSGWRENKIPVYPAIGNHELHGNLNIALRNYFQRFPDLKNSRYYSVRTANALVFVLDSALDENSGPHLFDSGVCPLQLESVCRSRK